MGKGSPRIRRSALSFLDARYVGGAVVNARADVSDAKDSDTPLRASLQTRSDYAFVDEIAARLCADAGVSAETAAYLARDVILEPGACLIRHADDRIEILHALLIERSPEVDNALEFDLRVVVRATIVPKQQTPGEAMRPPEVERHSVEVEEIDLDVDGDAQLFTLLRWLTEYRTEGLSSREPPQRPMAYLGKPTTMQAQDVPDSWRALLEVAAEVFGYRARIETDAVTFNGRLDKKTEWVFSFDPQLLKEVDRTTLADAEFDELTSWGAPFDEMLLHILRRFREAAEHDDAPATVHTLQPGEIFFHRKVGDSRGGHDNFSERSATPICSHGSNWRRFHGDKSRKGMARIYDNFTPDMLFHCGKYPNCNVYQVRA